MPGVIVAGPAIGVGSSWWARTGGTGVPPGEASMPCRMKKLKEFLSVGSSNRNPEELPDGRLVGLREGMSVDGKINLAQVHDEALQDRWGDTASTKAHRWQQLPFRLSRLRDIFRVHHVWK